MGNVSMIDGHIDEPRMTDKRAINLLSQMYLPCFDDEEKSALTFAINAIQDNSRQKAENKSLTEKLEALGDPLEYEQYKTSCLEAEVERLEIALKNEEAQSRVFFRQTKELQAEIERLTVNMNAFGRGMQIEAEKAETAKAEAIKEFDEQYKKIKTNRLICSYCYFKDGVDNLVKEKVGDAE